MNVFNMIKISPPIDSKQPPTNDKTDQLSKGKTQPTLIINQHQRIPMMNVFKNNQMLKQELLVNQLYRTMLGQQKQQVQETKITPTLLINKIQQSRPHYKNSVIYKELAFDILLETDKTYKIKNCASPARPNSEVYKRLSKGFFQNIKHGIDQCILFTGSQAGARIQSSIGNQSNPGIFMIIAIAILDEKYKEHHQRFDVEFSFLEYRSEKMYDLINYTQVPLEAKFRENSSNSQNLNSLEFCQHRVKVCTFLQFIKLFKIALFNNKERDIKTNKEISGKCKNIESTSQFSSSFIMKIRIKKYNLESQLVYEQETMLIDFDENCSLRNNGQKSEKSFEQDMKELHRTGKKTSQSSNRSLMDYILIEINNSNPFNKPIHYHMVEKNLLLEVMKKYLRQKQSKLPEPNNKNIQKSIVASYVAKQEAKQHYVGGSLVVINSFTTNPFNYEQNVKFYESLTSALGNDWEAYAKSKNAFNKCFDISYSDKILQKVIHALKKRKYTSLRDLYSAKQFYIKQSKKIISDIKSNRNVILQYLDQKKKLIYNQNVFTAYEFQLIGNCIKSDNFKDFYTSKSFLALPRQIQIKTEKIKEQITNGILNLKQVEEKFLLLKKKQKEDKRSMANVPACLKGQRKEFKDSHKNTNSLKLEQARASKTKFKLIDRTQTSPTFEEYDDLDSFNSLRRYIYDYFQEIWFKAYLTEERTVADQLIFEQFFDQQIGALKDRFSRFVKQVEQIEDVNIKSLDDQKMVDLDNLTQLIRSINQAKKSILKHEPKHIGHSPFALLKQTKNTMKQNIPRTTSYLPKIQQTIQNKKQKSTSIKSINEKKNVQVFQIKAKVDFGNLLLNPKRFS